MKDFLEWLGVNEKIAKIIVWLFIFMVMLIVINTCLESIGMPYYKITVENIVKIKVDDAINYIFACFITVFNFYSMIFLVFDIKQFKKIFKYSILYLILNILVNLLTDYGLSQIFIFIYTIVFCFIYSKKNWKYVLYGLGAIALNIFAQYVCYMYKLRFIDSVLTNQAIRIILSLDYFIIMGIIILVKEIYLKKRGEK